MNINKNRYLFTSERLGFRPWSLNDLDWFSQLNADPNVMEFFPTTLSIDQTAEMIQSLIDHYEQFEFTYFACEILGTEEPIGCVGLKHQTYASPFNPAIDIGWRLKASAWGLGYGTEAAQRCMDYAFNQLKFCLLYTSPSPRD